jgi:hypothetical protein
MGQIDTFDLPSTSIPPGSTINWVEVESVCGVTSVGGWYRNVLYTLSTLYYGTKHTPSDTYWHTIVDRWTTNPNTGLPWQISQINALEVGVELQSRRYLGYSWGTWCTQVFARIDYDLPPAKGIINQFNKGARGLYELPG